MKVLITGITGFIGGSLGRYGARAGHTVMGTFMVSQQENYGCVPAFDRAACAVATGLAEKHRTSPTDGPAESNYGWQPGARRSDAPALCPGKNSRSIPAAP